MAEWDDGREDGERGDEHGFEDVGDDEDFDIDHVGPDTETELDPEFKQELEGGPNTEEFTVEEQAEADAEDEPPGPADEPPADAEGEAPWGDTEEHELVEPPGAEDEAEEEDEQEPEEELEDEEAEEEAEEAEEADETDQQPALTPAAAVGSDPAQGGMPAGMQPPPGFVPQADAPDEKPPRPHLLRRFLAASLIVVATFAAATSISLLNWLSDIASALGHDAILTGVDRQLESVNGGKPQTILILGSDRRYGEKERGRSDTTILLRLDPNQNAISLLSIPRDLKVNIPGYGTDKFNAAYSAGGPKLTLKVVKQLTGNTPINHVVNVDFSGFFYAINAIECVFVDVDHRYYNSNEGVSAAAQYSEINLQPGYQRLCGKSALQYVRYRHQDNDIVRAARQHEFLREARQKVTPSKLIRDRKQLIRIFTRYTSSDIDNPETMLQVLKLFLASRSSALKEVHFPAKLGGTYVNASPAAIRGAVRQFLGITGSSGPRGALDKPLAEANEPTSGKKKSKKKGKDKKKKIGSSTLFDAEQAGKDQAFSAKNGAHFPVFYPTQLVRGTVYAQKPHAYVIQHADGNRKYEAYKMVMKTNFGEYYGLMGTKWKSPPILRNPSETRRIGSRTYLLFYDTDRLRLVAWKTPSAAYWLNNTLLQTLSEKEMLGIATTMGETKARKR